MTHLTQQGPTESVGMKAGNPTAPSGNVPFPIWDHSAYTVFPPQKTVQPLSLMHEKNTQRISSKLTYPGIYTKGVLLRLHFGAWWGSPQGGPLFLFRTPLKILSV